MMPMAHVFWTMVVMAIIFVPAIIASIWNIFHKPKEIQLSQHLHNATGLTSRGLLQSAFTLLCMPYEAGVSIDAIMRTTWRILISGRNLLEWNPSGTRQKNSESWVDTYRSMWIAPAVSIFILVMLILTPSAAIWLATPFLLIWIISPLVINRLGAPLISTKSNLRVDQRVYLRELARKTWSFFEQLVTQQDNWLPPDNLQQYPFPVIAHRTSPTNIGLSLLANLSAFDFGYSTIRQLLKRTSNMFSTMEKLERFKGHFYNWYDTEDLSVLSPRYVSTVDSGNLAGHLLTFRQGLMAIPHQKVWDQKFMAGLQDTLRLVILEISPLNLSLRKELQQLHTEIVIDNFNLLSLKEHVEKVKERYKNLISPIKVDPYYFEKQWIVAFETQLDIIHDEIIDTAPWLSLIIPDKFKDWAITSRIPTLAELSQLDKQLTEELKGQLKVSYSVDEKRWLDEFKRLVSVASISVRRQITELNKLIAQCYEFSVLEYDFLYDKSQHMLSIGLCC
jgi:cyclic beta-1,2-glucan synthetase